MTSSILQNVQILYRNITLIYIRALSFFGYQNPQGAILEVNPTDTKGHCIL